MKKITKGLFALSVAAMLAACTGAGGKTKAPDNIKVDFATYAGFVCDKQDDIFVAGYNLGNFKLSAEIKHYSSYDGSVSDVSDTAVLEFDAETMMFHYKHVMHETVTYALNPDANIDETTTLEQWVVYDHDAGMVVYTNDGTAKTMSVAFPNELIVAIAQGEQIPFNAVKFIGGYYSLEDSMELIYGDAFGIIQYCTSYEFLGVDPEDVKGEKYEINSFTSFASAYMKSVVSVTGAEVGDDTSTTTDEYYNCFKDGFIYEINDHYLNEGFTKGATEAENKPYKNEDSYKLNRTNDAKIELPDDLDSYVEE